MENDSFQKLMSSTNRKDRVFNVRKVNQKLFENEKYAKPNFSPIQKKQRIHQASSTQPKKADFIGLQMASSHYKELAKKYQTLKEQGTNQIERRLQLLRQKEQEFVKQRKQSERLQKQREKLDEKRNNLRLMVSELQQRNQSLRRQHNRRSNQNYNAAQDYQVINMEYLREMVMAMRYQNGLQIDVDNMTYEELLEFQQKIGSVSKGLTTDQFEKLEKLKGEEVLGELCSICYSNFNNQQHVNRLPCTHMFHTQCISEWLKKEKTCPLCKQQLTNTK